MNYYSWELVDKIDPFIRKQTTNTRKAISPEETETFLATGEIFHSLMYQYQVHRVTIGEFIPEVFNTIYHCLKGKYLNIPCTTEEWESIAEETYNRWHFPNPFEAADEKHIALVYPNGSGSEF